MIRLNQYQQIRENEAYADEYFKNNYKHLDTYEKFLNQYVEMEKARIFYHNQNYIENTKQRLDAMTKILNEMKDEIRFMKDILDDFEPGKWHSEYMDTKKIIDLPEVEDSCRRLSENNKLLGILIKPFNVSESSYGVFNGRSTSDEVLELECEVEFLNNYFKFKLNKDSEIKNDRGVAFYAHENIISQNIVGNEGKNFQNFNTISQAYERTITKNVLNTNNTTESKMEEYKKYKEQQKETQQKPEQTTDSVTNVSEGREGK